MMLRARQGPLEGTARATAGDVGVTCPLCGSRGGETYLAAHDPDGIFSEPFHLVRCRGSCGVIFVADAPRDQRDGLYTRDYYGGSRGRRLFRLLDGLLKLERVRLLRDLPTAGRLLDVGCGDGTFLALMVERGWKGTGIEASGAAAKLAGARHPELEIREGEPAGVTLPARSFDVITLWHVLEHAGEPKRLLRTGAALLDAGGALVVAVPNIESWQARVCGSKWFHLDVPRHRWHFTPSTLARLLASAGFDVIRIRHFSVEYNPYGWWQGLLNRLGCETNFAYKAVKRGESRSGWNLRRVYTCVCTIGLFPILFPLAFLLAILEATCGHGGTITVVATPSVSGADLADRTGGGSGP